MATVIDATYGASEGFAQVVVGHYEDSTLSIEKQMWFSWPEQANELRDVINKYSDKDVYFCTSLMSERTRGKQYATVTNVIYVDADTCAPENFLVEPSFVVLTSPGHYQLYWLLDQEVPADEAAELSHRMCIKHKDQGCDPSGWTVAKLMRVPGTTHGKTDNKHKVEVLESNGLLYNYKEIFQPYSDVVLPKNVLVLDRNLPKNLPMLADVLGKLEDAATYDLFQYEPKESDDRSRLRWRLALDCFRQGLKADEVFVVVHATKYNKYATDPGRTDEQLWREILKAEAEYRSEDQIEPVEKVVLESDSIKFISDEERESLSPTFIDEFENWVATRSPLAARKYSRFLAYMLLSSVYGSWGYANPQFGEMYLNLWGLLLGESTATRKSTARDLMLTVLNAWEQRLPEGKRIELGSDFTSEGLNAALAERDREVSFAHRDEIHGFFRELFTKNYLAGTVERMTDLYSGKVLMTMRASKNASQQKQVRAVFNFLGLGIEKETSEVLTKKYFRSGFLARFLWCVADAPKWAPEHEYVGRLDRSIATAKEDPQVTEFCNQFAQGRRKWDKATGPELVDISDEALQRWNEWKVSTKYLILGVDNEDIMEPSRDRLSYSVWKASALLAMHEKADRIELSHLLTVLAEAEVWFGDMVRMANSVALSEFEGRVNEVESFIAQTAGATSRPKIYSKFKHQRKGEVDELLSSLLSQGRIITTDGGYVINGRDL